MSDAVKEIVRKHLPARSVEDLRLDVPLASEGLDSIAIAEVLLECEDRFGVRLTELLEKGPVTIGAISELLARDE